MRRMVDFSNFSFFYCKSTLDCYADEFEFPARNFSEFLGLFFFSNNEEAFSAYKADVLYLTNENFNIETLAHSKVLIHLLNRFSSRFVKIECNAA